LLQRGNSKLGESIFHLSLPAVTTCPGASGVCRTVCYARAGRFRTRRVRRILAANLRAAHEDTFVGRMAAEIRKRCVLLMRWHVSGDVFSFEYGMKMVRVMELSRRTTFFLYTRSWRREDIRPALFAMAELPNAVVWLSCDRETGMPEPHMIPPRANAAFLQTEADEVPFPEVELVFRTKRLRELRPTFPLRTICTTERPDAPDSTCGSCGRCWRGEE
jgi:hypothetical protein